MPSPFGFSITLGPWLFDITLDRDEPCDVSLRYPAEASRLARILGEKRAEFAQDPRGWR
jgi:hypothetical protein